jgi:hypothetical protein
MGQSGVIALIVESDPKSLTKVRSLEGSLLDSAKLVE